MTAFVPPTPLVEDSNETLVGNTTSKVHCILVNVEVKQIEHTARHAYP